MPRQTFLNLPEEKRERILNTAIDEFSYYHFNDASINRIIDKAAISRGSFYQYFNDLEDLFRYIFKLAADEKQLYMNEKIGSNFSNDLFSNLQMMYTLGLQFAKDHPKLAKMANHLYKGDKQFKMKILGEWEEYALDYLKTFLKKGQEEGTVRLDLNVDVAANLFYQMNLTITDQYLSDQEWEENLSFHMNQAIEILKIFQQGVRPNS